MSTVIVKKFSNYTEDALSRTFFWVTVVTINYCILRQMDKMRCDKKLLKIAGMAHKIGGL